MPINWVIRKVYFNNLQKACELVPLDLVAALDVRPNMDYSIASIEGTLDES